MKSRVGWCIRVFSLDMGSLGDCIVIGHWVLAFLFFPVLSMGTAVRVVSFFSFLVTTLLPSLALRLSCRLPVVQHLARYSCFSPFGLRPRLTLFGFELVSLEEQGCVCWFICRGVASFQDGSQGQ